MSFAILFTLIDLLEIVSINVVIILMVSTLEIPRLEEILFWKNGHNITICFHTVNNKTLSCYSNSILDMVMWPKCSNSSSFINKVIKTSILWEFKKLFFFGGGWLFGPPPSRMGLKNLTWLLFFVYDPRLKRL